MMIPRVLKRSRPYCSHNTKLLDLPREVLIEIILRLPLKSVCSIQRASKVLNNIVDKFFVAQYYTRRLHDDALSTAQAPQIMLLARSHGINTVTKTFHPLQYHGGNALIMSEHGKRSEIIESQKCIYEVQFVFHNLICFKDVSYGGPSFLLNPLKGEVLRLPTSKVKIPASSRCRHKLFYWLAMGFDDTTSTLKILRVCGNSQYKNLVAQVLVLGTSSWREIGSVPPCNLSHKNVSAFGNMHWVIVKYSRSRRESNIISFDFKKEKFYWTSQPRLRSEGRRSSDFNLVNLRGCLAIVDAWLGIDEVFIDIWVLNNSADKDWEPKYFTEINLGINIEIPSSNSNFMGSCGEWEHGIFFRDPFFKDAISKDFENHATALLLDLRGDDRRVKEKVLVKCPIKLHNWTIISYTGSIISLKHYGNLVEEKACEYVKQSGFPEKLWKID